MLDWRLFACHVFVVNRGYAFRDSGITEAILVAGEIRSAYVWLSTDTEKGSVGGIGQYDYVFFMIHD